MVDAEVFGYLQEGADRVERCVSCLYAGAVAGEGALVVGSVDEPAALQKLEDLAVGLAVLQEIAGRGVWVGAVVGDFVGDNAVAALFGVRSRAIGMCFGDEDCCYSPGSIIVGICGAVEHLESVDTGADADVPVWRISHFQDVTRRICFPAVWCAVPRILRWDREEPGRIAVPLDKGVEPIVERRQDTCKHLRYQDTAR